MKEILGKCSVCEYSDEIKIGGFKLYCPELKIIIDETLDSKLNNTREWFMEHSGLNKGILLYVNSPGGTVYESDELYLKLKEYKEVTGRPVWLASRAA